MADTRPELAWWCGEMPKLRPADVVFERGLPETPLDAARGIAEAGVVALPCPGPFGQHRRMAVAFGVPGLGTVATTFAVAWRIGDRFGSAPITVARLTRLATLATAGFGQRGELADVRGERFGQRMTLAGEALATQSGDALGAAALDPGEAGRRAATAIRAAEAEPVAEGASVERGARGRRRLRWRRGAVGRVRPLGAFAGGGTGAPSCPPRRFSGAPARA
jgi:hypothetical protein